MALSFPFLLWYRPRYLCCRTWQFFIFSACSVAKSCLTLVTPWAVAHQAAIYMGLPRQEYRSGLLFPPPGDLPDPGIKPASPALASGFFTAEPPGKPFSAT